MAEQSVHPAKDSAQETQALLPTTPKVEVATGQVQPPLPGQDLPNFSWGGYFQGLGLLLLLMALLWFLVRLLRKYGRFNFIPRHDTLPRDAFFMEAQMPLGPRKNLVVVRFLERRLLIGVTEKEVRLLAEERTDAGQAEAEASFAAYLKEDSHDVSK